MGIIKSKFIGRKSKPERPDNKECSDDEEVTISSWELYDMEMVRKLQREFKNNTDAFILNNLLMSIMFFESYENGFLSIPPRKDNSKINPILLKEHQKSYIKPDILSEEINRNIHFKQRHGRKKDVSEPLLPQRMIIMYDNIQIGNEDEDHYSNIDKPTFKAQLVHAAKKGYVKLKYVDDDDRKASIQSQISNQTSNSDESSHFKHNDTEVYVYGPINDARTPKPLDINQNVTQNVFKTFIRTEKIKVKRDFSEENDDDDDDDEYQEHYLDSKVLMRHFRKVGFQEELGKVLGFTQADLSTAMYTTTGIFCNESNSNTHWEIIPAVLISWPGYHAYEWFKRADRAIITDRNKKEYQWPSNYMLNEIVNFNCIVIPRGYMPKRGVNEKHNLEWEIGFPQAEKYLETKLAHAHVRAYLFLVAIFKTFIEPETERKGLLIDHIKTLIFWEIEQNALSWPENKLGIKILKIIRNLYELLGDSRLPDYFIRDRNLFENIPNNKLWSAQDVLNRVMQCPVMYFIAALRNLEYVSDQFYQFPDLNKLYNILINSGLKNTNFGLHQAHQVSLSEKKSKSKEDDGKRKKNKQRAEEEEPRVSKDSLDFRWTSKNTKEDDPAKERLILMFFLDHFLTIVKDSIMYRAFNQSSFYIKHCFYLTKLLQENASNKIDADMYSEKIKTLERDIHIKQGNTGNPPLTPSRNSFYVPKTAVAAPVLPESSATDSKSRRSKTISTFEHTITDSSSNKKTRAGMFAENMDTDSSIGNNSIRNNRKNRSKSLKN